MARGSSNERLLVRHFFLGYDVALGRTWEFHDHLAARPDIIYRLHVIGRYPGTPEDLTGRPYVVRSQPFSRRWFAPRRSKNEVWIIRGWNHPLIFLTAVLARCLHVPTLMWSERPGATWEAADLKKALRIRLRQLLLPILFVPYRKDTILLGTGRKAVEEFERLSHGGPGREFPYPNSIADACLGSLRNGENRETTDEPLMLFVGNFTRLKAVDLIAEVGENLWNLGYRFRLRYVGKGSLQNTLEQHVRSSKNRAELFPYADQDALIEHFRDADCVLLPSRRDGWGLPIQEGLASGIPVITSDACGAAGLIAQSGCGKVIRAGDKETLAEAIVWVAELADQERIIIREKALRVAREMTIPKLADLLLSYCREALELRETGTTISKRRV